MLYFLSTTWWGPEEKWDAISQDLTLIRMWDLKLVQRVDISEIEMPTDVFLLHVCYNYNSASK